MKHPNNRDKRESKRIAERADKIVARLEDFVDREHGNMAAATGLRLIVSGRGGV